MPRVAIVTGSTFVMSPNKRASSAAANNPIRIIFATCNRGRSAAKRATNSPSRSAVCITAPSIAPATSRPGGRRPASIPLRSPGSSGGKLATAARLFHASDGAGFADLIIDGHRETWPLRGKRFQAWLRQQYYERTWDAPSPAALNAALNALEAQAQFDGPQRKVSLRLAEQDGLIYLDLADEFWRCVEIGANGWRIAEDPPVRFRRSAGMQPLPLPVQGGSIESLAPFLNLANENDFVLVVAWLLGALRAGGPYPVLAIAGEQGSAKTSSPSSCGR